MENRILIVDDEKDIRELLVRVLTRIGGFRVELAENGEDALQKISKDSYDLVLTDLKMPKMDGLQLVGEIARIKPETLTVLMTGHGSIDSALEAMKRGASDYLTKPLNLDELIMRLRKVAEQKQRFVSLKDYAGELERANEELRKVDQIKSEFVSIASHELRTPLSAIKNSVQLILQGKTGEINENQKKFLSMADRNITRLTNILNDLLNLSKIESGKITMTFEELALKVPVELVLSSLQSQAQGKSLQLVMDLPEDLPTVLGDREKLEQVLTNLVGNAIKFTPEGGTISVSAGLSDQDENLVAVSVRDTGIGIPEDQLKKVFEKFHQVEGSLQRSVSGTGLGLAITRGLIEAHQGTIWAESELGRGSTFRFTLPLSSREKRDVRFRLTLDREFQRAQENHSHLTLFLIEAQDDQPEMKEVILEQLEDRVKRCLCRKADIMLKREKDKILAALCEADLQGAGVIRQRLEEVVQKVFVKGSDASRLIHIGAATYPEEALSKRDLFRKAKERLGG
jgi:signal transduction histidine kinase/GGDEF domain-containing protein